MQESRVQLPLGALDEQDVGKPGIPRAPGARDRRFKSGRPDCDCGGTRVGTGRRLLIALTQVRFLPPQPFGENGRASQLAMAAVGESGRAMSLGSSTLSPSAFVPLAERQRCRASNPARRVRLPQGTLAFDRGSASGRPSGFEPGDGGSTPPPRTPPRPCVSPRKTDAGSSNGRMRRSERRHVGSSPAPAASQTEVIRPDEEPVLKTGGGEQPLVGSSPTASASGSWSNRTTPAPQAGNPGAIPGDSTPITQPRGPTATTLGPHPGNDGSTPSGAT